MAQELREGDGKSGIARAGKRKWGYDPAQVDAFLERAHALYDSEGMNLTQHDIQNVSFDLRKNGYVIAQVDAALGRLERAVVDKQTTWEIAQHGRVTWKAKTEKLYHEVQNHAERNERERFKSGAPKQPSYDKKQVDRLVDQIVDKAAAALGVDGVTEDDVRSLADLNANTVNNVIFTQRKGKKGYDERQVDYFLNACVQLLSRLESYARVADFVSGEPAAPAQTATNVTVQANGVSPLFASGTQRPATDERFVPAYDTDRNALEARRLLLDQLVADGKLPESNIHEMAADTRSADDIADVMDQADSDDASVRAAADAANDALLDDVASDYERELVNELGPEPVIDLMILGMGPDGHYASLFPGHDEVKVTDRLTVGVNHSPKMPPLRVSLTAPLIARSRHTWFFAAGAGKAESLAHVFEQPNNPDYPSSYANGVDEFIWFSTEETVTEL